MKKWISCAAVLSLLIVAPVTWAYSFCSATVPSVMTNGASIIVQRDQKVGTYIPTEVLSTTYQQVYSCPSTPTFPEYWHNFGFQTLRPFSGLKAGNTHIYETGYSGLGFGLGGSYNNAYFYWLPSGGGADGNINKLAMVARKNVPFDTNSGAAKVELYKIGPLSSGNFSGQIGNFFLGGDVVGGYAPQVAINLNTIRITVLTCSLTTPSVPVPLGNVQATAFSGIRSYAGTQSFDLGLNCDPGTRINVSLSGTQNTDTTDTSVLALTGAGNTNVVMYSMS